MNDAVRALARRAGVLASIFAVAVTAVAAAPSAPTRAEVLRATLSNGLRVVIVRNTLAPVVATSVNYLVGSDEAPAGYPGMAHAQEHMMFRGSPGLSTEQLADIGNVMGGNFNANTRESLTQYLYTVPSKDLDVALHIEAVRMQGVLDSKAAWEQERGAIEQEVAQDLSDPGYKLYEKLRAEMFKGTPYEHVALGTRPSFDKTTAAMLHAFYLRWYAPNNAILVVVGDVDPETTLAEIKTLFGGIAAKKLPPRPAFHFAPPKAASFTIPTDRPNGTKLIAMRIPGLDSPDFPALEVLSDVLSSHRFDLYGLVARGQAVDESFSLAPLPHAGIAYEEVSFPAGADPGAIESEVRTILLKVKKEGVPPELVAAAKEQERRQTEFQKNSIAGAASVWSDAIALYHLPSPDADLGRIEKVTVADVNRVARKYLDLDHAVAATALPQGSGKPVASSGGFGGQETISLGEAKPVALPEWAQAETRRLSVPKLTINPVVYTLPNGLTLIVQPETVSDTVGIYGAIRNRPETEAAPGKEGVSLVLEQLFPFGTESRDRLAFQAALDEIGASEDAGTNFSIEVLSKNFDRAAALLAENELHPALPQQAFDVIKSETQRYVAARNESPGYLAERAVREHLFPKTDPSLRDATPQSVGSLTLDDVRAYYDKVFRPDLTSIVVIGAVTPEAARATIEKYFGGWTATGPKPETDLPTAPPNAPAIVAVPDASRVQDQVLLAQDLGLNRKSPDYYALSLGNAVLGGGFYSSRLSVALRKETGLVYTVGSELEVRRTRGVYFIEYACDPPNVSKAAALVTREIANMQTTPVGQDELDRVKALLLRQIPLAESSVSAIARGFLDRRDLDLPMDEPAIAARQYLALTPDQVETAFKHWMRPGDLVRVARGPAAH